MNDVAKLILLWTFLSAWLAFWTWFINWIGKRDEP